MKGRERSPNCVVITIGEVIARCRDDVIPGGESQQVGQRLSHKAIGDHISRTAHGCCGQKSLRGVPQAELIGAIQTGNAGIKNAKRIDVQRSGCIELPPQGP